jgi:signal peptidase I
VTRNDDIPDVPDDDRRASEAPRRSGLAQLGEFAVMLVIAYALAQVVRAFLIQGYVTPTGSMEPTIRAGVDWIMSSKITLRFRDPVPGEIVMAQDPAGMVPAIMKRVIAVGGQTVDIRDGKVWIDGNALDEPYVHGQLTEPGSVKMPVTIPPGYVWLMGDNRTNSRDARWFGPQPMSSIIAIGFFRYWPPDRIGLP